MRSIFLKFYKPVTTCPYCKHFANGRLLKFCGCGPVWTSSILDIYLLNINPRDPSVATSITIFNVWPHSKRHFIQCIDLSVRAEIVVPWYPYPRVTYYSLLSNIIDISCHLVLNFSNAINCSDVVGKRDTCFKEEWTFNDGIYCLDRSYKMHCIWFFIALEIFRQL